MTGTVEDREKLAATLEQANQLMCEAQSEYQEARAYLQQFDADFPKVQREIHDAKGAEKAERLGSTGTTVEAEGNAALAAATGEAG